MTNAFNTKIYRFFHEILSFKNVISLKHEANKTSHQNKSTLIFNIFWLLCIILLCGWNEAWDSKVIVLFSFSISLTISGLTLYFCFKKPSWMWVGILFWLTIFIMPVARGPVFWSTGLYLAAFIVGGYYFTRKIYLASSYNETNAILSGIFLIALFITNPQFIFRSGESDEHNTYTFSSLFSGETKKDPSERLTDFAIKQSEIDQWRLAIPQAKGRAYEAVGYLGSYLQWLNDYTRKNFSRERDLEISTTELAKNINRVGETAFCIKQLIEDDRNFLRHNDKWYLLDSTLSWAEGLQQIMPDALRSKPVFFLNGREQELTCSHAIYTLKNAWDDEIKKHKKGDFYKTLVSIYGSEEAEFILRQLLLTNANYNYMKAEFSDLIND